MEFKKNLKKKKIEKKICFLVRTYVKPNVVFSKIPFTLGGGGGGGGGGSPKIKVAQNGVKHGLVSEFLRSDEIFEIWS